MIFMKNYKVLKFCSMITNQHSFFLRDELNRAGANVALSRRIANHWRLIGWGKITRGSSVPI
jgi:translation initiation factor 2 gamma subunit (eIF-2gamma)